MSDCNIAGQWSVQGKAVVYFSCSLILVFLLIFPSSYSLNEHLVSWVEWTEICAFNWMNIFSLKHQVLRLTVAAFLLPPLKSFVQCWFSESLTGFALFKQQPFFAGSLTVARLCLTCNPVSLSIPETMHLLCLFWCSEYAVFRLEMKHSDCTGNWIIIFLEKAEKYAVENLSDDHPASAASNCPSSKRGTTTVCS